MALRVSPVWISKYDPVVGFVHVGYTRLYTAQDVQQARAPVLAVSSAEKSFPNTSIKHIA